MSARRPGRWWLRAPVCPLFLSFVALVAQPARAQTVARFPESAPSAPVPVPAPSPAPTPRAPATSGAEELASRGLRHAEAGRIPEAIRAYSESIRLEPGNAKVLLALGRLRAGMGDAHEADLLFTAASRQRMYAAEALTERARLRRNMGREAEALVDMQAAADLAPGDLARTEELAAWYVARRAWLPALSLWRRLGEDPEERAVRPRAKLQIRALSIIAAELDPVRAGGAPGHSWERRAVARIAAR